MADLFKLPDGSMHTVFGISSIFLASLRHSFLASGSSHLGQEGAFFSGLGSLSFNFRFPGLPSNTLMAVGVGFLPLVAMGHPSSLVA